MGKYKVEKMTKCKLSKSTTLILYTFLFFPGPEHKNAQTNKIKQMIKYILVILYFTTFMDFVLSRFGQVYIQSFWVNLCLSIQDDTVYNNVG